MNSTYFTPAQLSNDGIRNCQNSGQSNRPEAGRAILVGLNLGLLLFGDVLVARLLAVSVDVIDRLGIRLLRLGHRLERGALSLRRDVRQVDLPALGVARTQAADRLPEVRAEPAADVEAPRSGRAGEGAHVLGHDVVLGEALLVPDVLALSLGVVDVLVLDAPELVEDVLLGVVDLAEVGRRVDERLGVLAELEELLVGEVPWKMDMIFFVRKMCTF